MALGSWGGGVGIYVIYHPLDLGFFRVRVAAVQHQPIWKVDGAFGAVHDWFGAAPDSIAELLVRLGFVAEPAGRLGVIGRRW